MYIFISILKCFHSASKNNLTSFSIFFFSFFYIFLHFHTDCYCQRWAVVKLLWKHWILYLSIREIQRVFILIHVYTHILRIVIIIMSIWRKIPCLFGIDFLFIYVLLRAHDLKWKFQLIDLSEICCNFTLFYFSHNIFHLSSTAPAAEATTTFNIYFGHAAFFCSKKNKKKKNKWQS